MTADAVSLFFAWLLQRLGADQDPSMTKTNPRAANADEAETRVRNLIADTERMLAGLSGFSSGRNQTNGVSV